MSIELIALMAGGVLGLATLLAGSILVERLRVVDRRVRTAIDSLPASAATTPGAIVWVPIERVD